MDTLRDARGLLERGQLPAAERVYERILEAEPEHVEALNVVALGALRQGRASRALELLKTAAAAAPADPSTQHHLGRVYQTLGDLRQAAVAHAKAVQLAPEFFVARLSHAGCLEQLGGRADAVVQYKRALDDAQRQGRWLDPGTTPEPLRPLVSHAVLAVRQGRRDAFEALLAPLCEKYGRSSMSRMERCLRIYLDDEPLRYADPRQRPTFLYFPDLPASPYLDLHRLEWVPALQAAGAQIREELQQLLPSDGGRERVFASAALEARNLRGTRGAPSWNAYYFFRHGLRRDDNCMRCPATAAALAKLPLSAIRDHGPEVLYSIFTPGTHLQPHRGVTNTRVVGHLPLLVPETCALKVGGELHHWRTNEVVVFDDTYEHEAWNFSAATRVVLIFDVWNPFLTEAERAAVTDIVGAIGDFRAAVESA